MSGSFFVPHDLDAPQRGAATGPLAGLTAVVKDMYDIAGSRTGGGNPDWLAAQTPVSRHAVAVEQILAAGATITGKTICDEFFYSVAGVNAHYGTPANLRAPGRLPGGSSSGSAAACGADACDFALGSDTGGSVRIPASFNGLYGLRPTHGRVDLTGTMAMAPTFDVAGWFANSPGIFRRVGAVLLRGEAVAAHPARLLVATDAFAQADTEVAALGREFLMRAGKLLPQPTELASVAPNGLTRGGKRSGSSRRGKCGKPTAASSHEPSRSSEQASRSAWRLPQRSRRIRRMPDERSWLRRGPICVRRCRPERCWRCRPHRRSRRRPV